MSKSGLHILVLGESTTSEMRGVVEAVLACFPQAEIRIAGSLQPACDADSERAPSLIVVCQSWPDEFSRGDVLRLFARFPLARWVCCFGLWCESDGRNRDAWPIGVRVPARDALGRLLRERDVLLQATPALPLTAGREEAFEFDRWSPARWSSSFSLPVVGPVAVERTTGKLKLELQPSAAVRSPDGELRRCFEDRLRGLGYDVTTPAGGSGIGILLFDADPWNSETADRLRTLRSHHSDTAVIALMNFAPPEDVRAVRRCGADAVLSKLAGDGELAAVLDSGS